MNTDRIKQILGVDKSKKSVNTDIHLKVNIENKERLLPPDEITHIVNVGDRFNSERQQSKFYRILGTINPTISNSLFNLDNPANTLTVSVISTGTDFASIGLSNASY